MKSELLHKIFSITRELVKIKNIIKQLLDKNLGELINKN